MQNKHQLEWARNYRSNRMPMSDIAKLSPEAREIVYTLEHQSYLLAQAIIADAEATPPIVDDQTIEAEYSLKYWRYTDDGKTIKIFFKGAE
jgi:hypothetical protein